MLSVEVSISLSFAPFLSGCAQPSPSRTNRCKSSRHHLFPLSLALFLQGVRFHLPRLNPYDLDDIPTEYRAMLAANYPPRRDDDIDGWFDYFQREIANYKQAIRRVIQDVIQLREQHKTLTAANADLKLKIDNFDKKKKVLYEIFEGDKIDKAKMQDIFSKRPNRVFQVIGRRPGQ